MISLEKPTQVEIPVFWKQIFLLIALEGAVTIGWFAYEKYQPILLGKYHFEQLVTLLVVAQGLLGAIFNPLSGYYADKMYKKLGSKFPVIIAGITFAAIIFMAVSIVLLADSNSPFRFALPFLVILWLAAMSTFHSPAVSLVESLAPKDKIPYVSALLVIVFGLVYAIGPVVVLLLNTIGLTATFILGGLLLAITGYALKNGIENDKIYNNHARNDTYNQKYNPTNPSILSIMGFFIGLCKAITLFVLPVLISRYLNLSIIYTEAITMASAALIALPVSKFIEKFGENKILIAGCIMSIICFFVGYFFRQQMISYVVIIMSGFIYGTLAVSALPFVLNRTSPQETGSGMGLFYGGVAAASASISLLFL